MLEHLFDILFYLFFFSAGDIGSFAYSERKFSKSHSCPASTMFIFMLQLVGIEY